MKPTGNTIEKGELETIDAIEMHGHLDSENDFRLLETERIRYMLTMSLTRDNAGLLSLAERHKDRVGILLWILPTESWQEDSDRLIRKHGTLVKGIKIHPAKDAYRVTGKVLRPVFEYVSARGMILETHTEAPHCSAGLFRPMLESFPETKLILVHGTPGSEAYEIIRDFKNVYVDTTAGVWSGGEQGEYLRRIGPARTVLGLDSPFGFPRDKTGKLLPHFRNAIREVARFYHNDRAAIEQVLTGNARRILS